MTLTDFIPTTDDDQRHTLPPGILEPAQPAPAAEPGEPGELLQVQLKCLILDILADPNVDPDTRLSLLRSVTSTPGHPEQALLHHLGHVQDPEDLRLYGWLPWPATPRKVARPIATPWSFPG